MKIGKGVDTILRVCLSNSNSCNVGTFDGRALRSTRLTHVQWHDTYTVHTGINRARGWVVVEALCYYQEDSGFEIR